RSVLAADLGAVLRHADLPAGVPARLDDPDAAAAADGAVLPGRRHQRPDGLAGRGAGPHLLRVAGPPRLPYPQDRQPRRAAPLMCGLTGFIGQGDREDLVAMTRALSHRGPDGEGFFVDGEAAVFLGHRRLAVVDLPGGAQPMWNEDDTVGVLFN